MCVVLESSRAMAPRPLIVDPGACTWRRRDAATPWRRPDRRLQAGATSGSATMTLSTTRRPGAACCLTARRQVPRRDARGRWRGRWRGPRSARPVLVYIRAGCGNNSARPGPGEGEQGKGRACMLLQAAGGCPCISSHPHCSIRPRLASRGPRPWPGFALAGSHGVAAWCAARASACTSCTARLCSEVVRCTARLARRPACCPPGRVLGPCFT